MNKFFAIITIVIIGIVLVFFFLTDIRMSLVEMFFCVFACIAFPMKDHYDEKRDNHDNLLSGWVRVLSPVVVFLVLRYIWWPMHKNSLDAEVARQMEYHVVWYEPDQTSNLILVTCVLTFGLLAWDFIWTIWKEMLEEYKNKFKKIVHIFVSIFLGIVALILSYFLLDGSDRISATYFGKNQIAIVSNWFKDDIIILDRKDLTYEYGEIDEVNGYRHRTHSYCRRYKIHSKYGGWATIEFSTDKNYKLERISIDEPPCDREQVIRAITSLPEYKK